MRELAVSTQRKMVLTSYALLIIALCLQPLYLAMAACSEWIAHALYFVPAIFFLLIIVSAALSIWVEQTTSNETVRTSASRQIWVFLALIILGMFSAIQASSWWRIESESFAQLLNLTAVAAAGLAIMITLMLFAYVRRNLPTT